MKVIDLLVEELPLLGGWPEGVARLAQDPNFDLQKLSNRPAYWCKIGWIGEGMGDYHTGYVKGISRLASDHNTTIVTREEYEEALKKSYLTKRGVNEDYVPKVGEECEFKQHTEINPQGWRKGIVRYISENTVVMKVHGIAAETVGHSFNFEYRPIDKEREEAIHEIASMIGRGTFFEDAERIYDAGYRKQK